MEVDGLVDQKKLSDIVDRCYRKHGNAVTSVLLDHIKETGFRYSTIGAITISMGDIEVPEEKYTLIEKAEKEVDKFEKSYRRGLISNDERYDKVIEIWNRTTEEVTEALMESFDHSNNIYIMALSGARGSKNQIRQLAGMRGLMASASGRTVEINGANFREGLSVLNSSYQPGSRKGLADTALRTELRIPN